MLAIEWAYRIRLPKMFFSIESFNGIVNYFLQGKSFFSWARSASLQPMYPWIRTIMNTTECISELEQFSSIVFKLFESHNTETCSILFYRHELSGYLRPWIKLVCVLFRNYDSMMMVRREVSKCIDVVSSLDLRERNQLWSRNHARVFGSSATRASLATCFQPRWSIQKREACDEVLVRKRLFLWD